MRIFNELLGYIEKSTYILIAGHVSPDGDAIGACVAMAYILNALGKKYSVLLENPSPKYNYLLDNINLLTEAPKENCDLFITLDCGDADRIGLFKELFENSKYTCNIDHHISNTNFAQFNYVDANASSTSEIIFRVCKDFEVDMNANMAEAIYTGIVYDTSAFRHTNTTSQTLLVASELLKHKFDFSKIIYTQFYERSYASVKLQGVAINNIENYFDNKVILSTLSIEEINNYSKDAKEAEGIVNLLKNIEGSKIAVFLYEKSKNEIKISMRAEDPYDVCEIAKVFGGGGHTKASGATFFGSMLEAKEQVMPIVLALIK